MLKKNPVRLLSHGVFYGLLFLAPELQASDIRPLATRDQNPLVMVYGLPAATPAQIPPESHNSFMASLDISNTNNQQQSANEQFFIDAESYQLNLIYEQGLSNHWMLRIQLPFIGHSGGFLDAWIDDYHDLLDLPEGIRPAYPRDQLAIRYESDHMTLLDVQQRSYGPGDLSIQLARQISSSDDFALSYWSSIKLPSGDSDDLTGSGSVDLALWLAGHARNSDTRAVYGNLGVLLMSDSDVLAQLQKHHALFGVIGIHYQPWQTVQLKAQLDMHSALYESRMEFLGNVVQLSFGGSLLLNNHSSLDIAVAEDIDTGASPDVNFNVTWRMRFD